ncbi:hypothetical protein LJR129_003581 [Acidovorax sp. LjRoot129]|uniref:hypothetical protein n=1 Tax=Acidovorax sp. LjRoot129 TaxID=3342260 RepID=UPI003ECFDB78
MTIDIAVLAETQRQGDATRAALGVQLRSRPVWSGAGRFTGVPVRYANPYRLRGVNSPELLYENIVHNGTVYCAEGGSSANVYTSTDLKIWTARQVDVSTQLMPGKLMAAGSLLFTATAYSGNGGLRTSVDHGVTWNYQGSVGTMDSLCAAGGIGYAMGIGVNTAFRTMTAAAPVPANRNFATAQQWRKVLHNGVRWLALNEAHSVGEWSANGLDGWVSSAGLAAALASMPNGTRRAYALGGRFLVVTLAEGTLSGIYSDDASAWSAGAVGDMEPTGLRVAQLGESAAEMGGVLYIPVKLTDGATYWTALVATADGTKFKWLPSFWRGAEALPSIRTRVGGGGLVFNGSGQAGVPPAARYESNPDALEVYFAI